MRTTTAKPISGIAEVLANGVLIGIALILMASPANARSNLDRSVGLASQQWQLVDRITKSTMLAALGFNTERGVRAIEEARDLFSRRLRGLRGGDAELGLVATTAPEALNQIARLEAIWPRYDATLRTIITELRTAPEVDESHIRDLTDIHALIIEAIDDTTNALRATAANDRVSAALDAAEWHRVEALPVLDRVAPGEEVDEPLIATASSSLTE